MWCPLNEEGSGRAEGNDGNYRLDEREEVQFEEHEARRGDSNAAEDRFVVNMYVLYLYVLYCMYVCMFECMRGCIHLWMYSCMYEFHLLFFYSRAWPWWNGNQWLGHVCMYECSRVSMAPSGACVLFSMKLAAAADVLVVMYVCMAVKRQEDEAEMLARNREIIDPPRSWPSRAQPPRPPQFLWIRVYSWL